MVDDKVDVSPDDEDGDDDYEDTDDAFPDPTVARMAKQREAK